MQYNVMQYICSLNFNLFLVCARRLMGHEAFLLLPSIPLYYIHITHVHGYIRTILLLDRYGTRKTRA